MNKESKTSVNREHFDLIIIGTGSGNSIITPDFDEWKIAIIEKGVFGGTCLNRGCIPSKMLVHTANVVNEIIDSEALGVDASVESIRWADIMDRVYKRIDPIAEGGESYRQHLPNVTVYKGHARFVGNKTLEVNSQELTAENIVIATGAKPFIPDIAGLNKTNFHTSDSIMRISEFPESMTIIGGGYIATELAHVFSSLGSRVSLVARGQRLLKAQDKEISEKFTGVFRKQISLYLESEVQNVTTNEAGGVNVSFMSPAGLSSIESDILLVATGRTPTTDELNLDATDIAIGEEGYVVTNEQMSTTVPGVYALGDVTNPAQLKHTANAETRVISNNLIHPSSPVSIDLRPTPYAIFTRPQIASVGANEEELTAHGVEYIAGKGNYSEIAYGWAMEETDGFCKVLADPHTGNILGAHILGPHASTLIHQLVQAMKFGQTVHELSRGMLYVHPALNEVVEIALIHASEACY